MELTTLQKLKMPFPENRVHWRVGSTNAKRLGCKPWEATKGSALAYVDARDVMKRLDDVVGMENWQCRYPLADSGLLICEVGLLVADEWIWKANGAGDTQVEAEKGKCSDAFKRAAVLWGIAQYLYYLPTVWSDLENGKLKSHPPLPQWATPEGYITSLETKEDLDEQRNRRKAVVKKPMATEAQRLLLQDFVASGDLNVRQVKYIEANIDKLTVDDAKELLSKITGESK